MQERDLILGVLATQAGFVTPLQVMEAAATRLIEPGGPSLLARLESAGLLSPQRRALLEAMANEALAASDGRANRVLETLGGEVALVRTFGPPCTDVQPSTSEKPRGVPLERDGQYTRVGELGRGGQSVVWRAVDEFVGREVALKELVLAPSEMPPTPPSSSAARGRFLREARLTARLDHPGIVAVHELAQRPDGTLFCAQKLIRGETLKVRLARCESLRQRLELLPHLIDACQATAYAHSRGVLHRDLKPSNIMVGEFGETVVVDWGLAKQRGDVDSPDPGSAPGTVSPPDSLLTVAGVALGTPSYMSPEHAQGALAEIDERSDVFSLGAILSEVLTGRVPFEGVDTEQVIAKAAERQLPPMRTVCPEAPPELAAIADRAVQRAPGDRYPTAEALARDLSTFLAGGRVGAYQYGAWELVQKFISGHPALTTGLAVALAALLVSAVVVAIRLHAARRDLANSFVERAYTAEQEADWARAAAYFAAARVQHDTREAQWGLALAGENTTERILALHLPPESFTDVGVLSDGRVVALGISPKGVEVREVESGRTLWTLASEPVLAAALLPGGQVRLSVRGGWAFYNAATGARLGYYDRSTVGRPCPGPFPTPAVVLHGQLILRPGTGPPRPVATDVSSLEHCHVSDDGRQVAYQDTSEVVHLLAVDDGRELARHPGFGLTHMLFTRHGLVLVKVGGLEVFGGPEGDYLIELPEGGLGSSQNQLGGSAVSPDGHLVAVARRSSNRADVVDLRIRNIRGTFNYAAGAPRFAFSGDGQDVFVAGLQNGASLSGWRLPPAVPTTHPGSWRDRPNFSSGGSRLLLVDNAAPPSYALYGRDDRLLARGDDPLDEVVQAEFAGDGPIVAFEDSGKDGTVVRDLEQGRILWRSPCGICRALGISADSSRLVRFGVLQGLEVWDTRANRLLFKEVDRVGRFETLCALSPDGRHVAWTQDVRAIVRDLESGQEGTLPLDGVVRALRFSPDSARLASVTTGSIALWDAETRRLLWRVANAFPARVHLSWSADGLGLLVDYEALGTELLDARTGERLARFLTTKLSGWPSATYVQPDLRAKVVMTRTHWERRPLPEPATESPAEGLKRTLQRTGLMLQGVELVAAP
jgi:WD40 repeat protein